MKDFEILVRDMEVIVMAYTRAECSAGDDDILGDAIDELEEYRIRFGTLDESPMVSLSGS